MGNRLMLKVLAACLLLTLAGQVHAQEQRYIGVWQRETGANLVTGPLSFSAFVERGVELIQQGLRLFDFKTFETPTGLRYVGVWRSGFGSNLIVEPLRALQFRQKREELSAQSLRLTSIQAVRIGDGVRFIGLWRDGTGSDLVTHPMTRAAFLSRGKSLTSEGLQLVNLDTLPSGGTRAYVGLWRSGSGPNLITEPLPFQAFLQKRDELTAQNLHLASIDAFVEGGETLYVGVWRAGGGENMVTAPRTFPEFVTLGEQLTQEGLRLTKIAVVHDVITASPGGGPGLGHAPVVSFPPLPPYLKLSGGTRLVVDFSRIIDDHPEMTIPTGFLPVLPEANDELIFPNNFCGVRVFKAARFLWLDPEGVVVDQHPYNHVPEEDSVVGLFGDTPFRGGIDFTGPIGACTSPPENWHFPFPLTTTGENPRPGLKLVFELQHDSRLEFLNFNIQPGDILGAHELFKDDIHEEIKEIIDFWKQFEIDSGYCGIDQYVKKVCKETPTHCPVADDFDSPC